MVRDSIKLQYLIELGRDCLVPVHSQTSAAALLEEHLRLRDRRKNFILNSPNRCPPGDSEFHIYEFCGGSLAHCSPGTSQDTICFQRLDKPASLDGSHMSQMVQTPLSFKCAEFSFDPMQDLLVVIEDCGPYVSFSDHKSGN